MSLWPHTHWLQSRKDVRHLDDKVDQVGDDADRDKLSNLSCCLFVAKTGDKSQPYRQQSRPYWRQSILSPVCRRRLVTFAKKCAVYKSTYFLTCFVAGFSISRFCCQCVPGSMLIIFICPPGQTGRQRRYILTLSVCPSVRLFVHPFIRPLQNL